MDRLNLRHWVRDLQSLPTRLRSLSKPTQTLRLPLWGWAPPLALLLATCAHQGSKEEGKLAWLMENTPQLETWGTLLTLKGYSPVEDPEWLEEAYAEMPEIARTKNSAFIAENSTVIAFRTAGEWLYFRLAGGKASTDGGPVIRRSLWIPLGIGWEAIAALDRVEIPKYEAPKNLARSKPAWKDPRSLEF